MTMTIMLYLLPLAYFILQLMINTSKPPKTLGIYSKSLPFAFPDSYLLISTYMMSSSFVSLLLVLSVFVSSTIIVNPWASIFFPRKVVWSRPVVPTDYDDPKEFLPKRTKLSSGWRLLLLGLLATKHNSRLNSKRLSSSRQVFQEISSDSSWKSWIPDNW